MRSTYPHPIVAREGWPFLAMAVAVSALVTWFATWWSLPFWLVSVFVLQFFRDPGRSVPTDPALVSAPADGRIVVVEQAQDPFSHDSTLKISVFMNVFNVHSNRSPVDGEVTEAKYHVGGFVNAALDKASLENERNALRIRLDNGAEVTCVQIAGLVARRILCYAKPGDRLVKGQRFGFIRFGSRVDVYLPPGSRPRVAIGDKVYAGETVLAELETATTGK
jgi:phosphatidylserine decarboxylase